MWCGVAGCDKEANESLWQVCTGLSRLCDVCELDFHKCMCVCVCVSSVCGVKGVFVCVCVVLSVCVCLHVFI